MKQSFSLKLAGLLILAIVSFKSFAADSDAAKLNSAADESATCQQDMALQKAVIYYEGDDAALAAQLSAYWENDSRREGDALVCLNGIGAVVDDADTDPSFAQRIKNRLRNLLGTLAGKIQKNENLRINGPVATIGVRG